MMKRILSILLLIAFTITLCACQPTPDESFVVSKNDGKLEETLFGEAAPVTDYNFPTEWRGETFKSSDKSADIIVDAEVLTPDVEKFPVYYIVPGEEMTQEYADMLMNYFIGDKQLIDVQPPAPTKNEILDEIERLEEELNDPNSETNTTYKEYSEGLYEEQVSDIKQRIESLQNQYPSAPMEPEIIPVSRTFTPVVQEDGTVASYSIEAKTDDGSAYVSIWKDTNTNEPNYKRTAKLSLFDKGGSILAKMFSATDVENYGMENYTMESAKELADNTLHDLGKDGYDVVFTCASNVHYELMDENDDVPITQPLKWTLFDLPRGYTFIYTKTVDNIPTLIEYDSMKSNEGFSPDWPREYLTVTVSNEGVCTYYEFSSTTLGDKINENVPLLPFEKIQEIFRNYIAMKVSLFNPDEYTQIQSHDVTINDIRLGYVRISEKNRIDRGYLVPVWMFYGDEVYTYASQNNTQLILDENNQYHPYNNIGHAYLCINAIDGSIIDLIKGY